MKSDKKGAMGIGAVILIVLVVLGLGGGAWFAISQTGIGGTPEIVFPTGATGCPDDGLTTLSLKVKDDKASSETFVVSTVYIKNLDSGIIENSTATSASVWVQADVTCGANYELWAVSTPAVVGGSKIASFKAEGNAMYKTLHSNVIGEANIRVKDLDADSFLTLFVDAAVTGTNATTFTQMNVTGVYSDGGPTDISVGADGHLNYEMLVQTDTVRQSLTPYSDVETFNTYMCVDVGTDNEWAISDAVVSVNGVDASNDVKSSIDADSLDASVLQVSDACYLVGDIDRTIKTIGFYLTAKDGADPDTSNDDVAVYFLSEGLYISSENGNMVQKGIFTDASTPLAVTYLTERNSLIMHIQ